MTLSEQQLEAARGGEAVEVTADGETFVLLSKGVFDRVRRVLEYNDGDVSPRETYPAVLRAIDQDDENPDQYLEYLHANDPRGIRHTVS